MTDNRLLTPRRSLKTQDEQWACLKKKTNDWKRGSSSLNRQVSAQIKHKHLIYCNLHRPYVIWTSGCKLWAINPTRIIKCLLHLRQVKVTSCCRSVFVDLLHSIKLKFRAEIEFSIGPTRSSLIKRLMNAAPVMLNNVFYNTLLSIYPGLGPAKVDCGWSCWRWPVLPYSCWCRPMGASLMWKHVIGQIFQDMLIDLRSQQHSLRSYSEASGLSFSSVNVSGVQLRFGLVSTEYKQKTPGCITPTETRPRVTLIQNCTTICFFRKHQTMTSPQPHKLYSSLISVTKTQTLWTDEKSSIDVMFSVKRRPGG